MKTLILPVIIFSVFSLKAVDSEKIVKSKPEKIIVYTQGAQVHRSVNVTLQPGPNTIVFSGLENCINTAAIQASGNGNFIIADTQYEVFYPELEKSKNTGDIKYIFDITNTNFFRNKQLESISDITKHLHFT